MADGKAGGMAGGMPRRAGVSAQRAVHPATGPITPPTAF